jgi:hypothetical protein
MFKDFIFHSERNLLRKLALLLTIPCAILPIIFSTAGLMSGHIQPMLFSGDYVLFGFVYLLYFYGLLVSFRAHRKIIPYLIFALHVCLMVVFTRGAKENWWAYLSIVSSMATSVVNQYYRIGSIVCNDDCLS